MTTETRPPFDLEGILTLRELVERGSVLGASRALGVSRATIRRRLEFLEASVGVQLLHRGEQGVQPTPAGAVLLDRGRQLLDEATAAWRSARSAASEALGLVRIIIPVGLPSHLVTQILANVHSAGLEVRIELAERPDPTTRTETDFDLMFHFGAPPDNPDLFSRVIRRAPVHLVASPAYLTARGVPQSVDELVNHPLLVWQGGGYAADRVQLRAGGDVPIEPWLITPNVNVLRRLAAVQRGLAYAPDGGLPDELGVGELVPVLVDEVGRDETFRATSPLPTRVDPRAAAFATRIHALLSAWPES